MTELTFKGKEFVYNHHLSVPFRPLVPHAGKGIGEVDLSGNLIIQGDNLHALKALLPRYAGKVDCIFIDPPYNTGNEGWAYNDNVNAPMIKEWLAANPIGIEDGLRHDKWCAMMWPRLRLLHELLADTGSIWITLDDNEAHRAKLMLDEIFGEKNFVSNIIWQKKYSPANDAKWFSDNHDSILVFAKNKELWRPNQLNRSEAAVERYTNRDNDTRGVWKASDLSVKTYSAIGDYPIVTPSGREIRPPKGRSWGVSSVRFDELVSDNRVWFGVDGSNVPSVKKFITEVKDGVTPLTVWTYSEVGHNQMGMAEIKAIFADQEDVFDTPKPSTLIRRIVDLATDSDSLILDSFAGSGTTAHAVLEANRRDGGSRKFILVEMEDYADRLTAERVRRVINGYAFSGTQKTELLRENLNWRVLQKADDLVQKVNAIDNLHSHEYTTITKQVKDGELIVTGEKAVAERSEGLGGSFTYCTLGPPIELDAMLTGKHLPSYEALGSLLYHMATGRILENGAIREDDFHLGEHGDQHVWLIYKPDLEWLKGAEAALTLSFARQITAAYPGKSHLVLAASRFVSDKLLNEHGMAVEFVPLPYALYRIEQG